MFLKKLFTFGKDYSHYLEKGDKYLAAERFADARNAYGEALEKIEASGEAALSQVDPVRRKIALTGNMLGRLNLVEAEYALSSGDGKKAGEHLRLIMDLADDATLRENAERLLAGLDCAASGISQVEAIAAAPDGGGATAETGNNEHQCMDDAITREDRVSLYYQTLPGDLPERYAEMGEDFARGCLLTLEGNGEQALKIFEDVPAETENDILRYEKAILYFHRGDSEKCQELLLAAIAENPVNPLCHIGLVHLYTETGRETEALQVLEKMIAGDLMPEQALLMQGELYALLQDESSAVESYSRLLTFPRFAKEAAQLLAPLLERQGRTEEAAYLVKKYVKGCR